MPIKLYSVKFVCVLFLLICCCLNVEASIIDGLFDAKVAVDNQSDKSKSTAFKQGIKQVLVKVRGNDDLLKDKQINRAVSRVDDYLKSYSYAMQGSQLYITINFDQERIESLIRNSGYPIWGKRRADSLVWLALEARSGAPRKVVTPDTHPDIYLNMTNQAAARGIKLVYPIWDLDDVQNLNVYDIWGGFSQMIEQASLRYDVQSVLSARIYQYQDDPARDAMISEQSKKYKTGQWLADWTTIDDGKYLSGQISANSLVDIAPTLLNELADQLSAKYAVDLDSLNSEQSKIQIVINNIDKIESYVHALAFLEGLSVVNTATLIHQQGTKSTFELSLFGKLKDLTNAFNLDHKISPVMDEFGQSLGNSEFIWYK